MDVTELRELIQHLTALETEAKREPEEVILPPTLNAGKLELEAIRLFMSQFNAEPGWLQNNANRLWAQLGKLSARGELPFDVYCSKCGKSVREPCLAGQWPHILCEAKYFVMTPATILKHGPGILNEPTSPFGLKTHQNFETLLRALQA